MPHLAAHHLQGRSHTRSTTRPQPICPCIFRWPVSAAELRRQNASYRDTLPPDPHRTVSRAGSHRTYEDGVSKATVRTRTPLRRTCPQDDGDRQELQQRYRPEELHFRTASRTTLPHL